MSPPHIAYSTFLLIAGTLCLFVSFVIVYTRRNVAGASSLAVLLVALAWWDITYAIFWAGTPGITKYFWLDITYAGAVTVPAALFVFSMQFTNKQTLLKNPLASFLYIEPLFVLISLFTDPYHGLFFAGKRVENSALILDAGPVFWFNVVYSYVLVLLATIIFLRAFLRSSGIYRKQLGVILLGISFTWINSIVFVLGLHLLPGADNTPFSFTITALAFAFAIWRYQLLDIIPVARDSLIEKMVDGVLVIDMHNRIVDMNPSAQHLLSITVNTFGRPVEEVVKQWSKYEKESFNFTQAQTEIELNGRPEKHIDMQVTTIQDGRGKKLGRLIILHDITKLKLIQNELHILANIDALTGANNRGHFMELAGREIQRANRYKRNLSMVLMDMDYFKKINDTYGHASGDQALVTLKTICTQNTRKMDIFARLGGEEFALLLPETGKERAVELADRLRRALQEIIIQKDEVKFKCTISMGVAEFFLEEKDSLEALLHRSDKALYKAKADGRNRVVGWTPELE